MNVLGSPVTRAAACTMLTEKAAGRGFCRRFLVGFVLPQAEDCAVSIVMGGRVVCGVILVGAFASSMRLYPVARRIVRWPRDGVPTLPEPAD